MVGWCSKLGNNRDKFFYAGRDSASSRKGRKMMVSDEEFTWMRLILCAESLLNVYAGLVRLEGGREVVSGS